MNSVPLTKHCQHRILAFSDTYGIAAGNGVARFLHDLRRLTQAHGLPLELVVPMRERAAAGLIPIRAPTFSVPGYPELKISMPLRHHRKQIERHIRHWRPDCIHVSTPGPFGCFGLTLARRYRIPLVGIYHTDFGGYAHAVAAGLLSGARGNFNQILGSASTKLLPMLLPSIGGLLGTNPQLIQDFVAAGEILSRNLQHFSSDPQTEKQLATLAEDAVTMILKKFYSHFDLLIARTAEQRDVLVEKLQFATEKICCLQPGTDVTRFHPGHADRTIWPQFGIPQDASIVLYVGRVTAEKNIHFLRDVWINVQTRCPNPKLRLVVVGNGAPHYLSRLQQLDHVHVLGPQHGNTLSKIYASADLLVFPSTTETLGQVGMEAGASGLPVIVTDQGGPRCYVRNAQTGFVLSADDPHPWSDCIIEQTSGDRRRLREMGTRARDHIANHFSLDHSLQSYWNLHHQAIKNTRKRSAKRPKSTIDADQLVHLRGQIPNQGVMLISDFHAGKRYGNQRHREQKRAAIKAMLSMAIGNNYEVIFGGDFGDHGSRLSRLEADFQAFRDVRRELRFHGRPIFVRGNHDYGFSDQRLEQLTGGCRVHDGLVYFHSKAKVTVCHGHILGLSRTLDLVHTAKQVDQMLAQFREDLLDKELQPSVIAYDIANMIETALARQGLRGLSTAWEGIYQYRAMVAEQLLKLARSSDSADEATWKMIAGLVGTHDNLQVAGLLGIACGGWASLFGHTHEPLAKRVALPVRDRDPAVTQIVGNAGHINRKHPTCVVADFPHVTLYQFESKSQLLRPLRRVSLSRSEIDAFVKHSNDPPPSQLHDSNATAVERTFLTVAPDGPGAFHTVEG